MNENLFRSITLVLIVLLGSISAFYRGRAAQASDTISRRDEGVTLMIFTRLFLLLMSLGVFIYMINPKYMSWSTLPLPNSLRLLGISFSLIVVLMYLWILSTLGNNVTGSVAIRRNHILVISGPYRWVRHPLYAVRLFFLFPAFFLLSASWFVGLMGLLWFTMLALRTHIEEAKLIEKNGEKYRIYASRTGRFLPRLKPLK